MIAYFDCFSGISGDMTLGALVDLGVPLDWLTRELKKILPHGFELSVERVKKNGISATSLFVHTDDDGHHHHHDKSHHGHHHSRNYSDIRKMVENADISPWARKKILLVFKKIAVAEAAVHEADLETIHFHEVGGVDSIVDISGTVLALEYLGIEELHASRVPLGSGFVNCSHGTIPVPAPATIEILKGVPVYGSAAECEIVTPTGAGILAALCSAFGRLPEMTVKDVGYGSGKRDIPGQPNLLRIVTGVSGEKDGYIRSDKVMVVETSVDDMNPELFGYVMDKLFEDGALDVCWIPVYMKKNRPATRIEVVCREGDRQKITRRILRETTTIGVRYYPAGRDILKRELDSAETSLGTVKVKVVTSPEGEKRVVPEYESVKEIAAKKDLPIKDVYERVLKDL